MQCLTRLRSINERDRFTECSSFAKPAVLSSSKEPLSEQAGWPRQVSLDDMQSLVWGFAAREHTSDNVVFMQGHLGKLVGA